MFPCRRTANRAVRQSLWKRFGEPDHPITRATQRRINPENDRVRLASTGGTVHGNGRRNPFASGQAALHSRELLRSEAHATNRAKACGLAKRNSEIRRLSRLVAANSGVVANHPAAPITFGLRSPSRAKEPSASSRDAKDNLPHIEGYSPRPGARCGAVLPCWRLLRVVP